MANRQPKQGKTKRTAGKKAAGAKIRTKPAGGRHAGREQSHRTRVHQREVPHTAAGRRQRRPNKKRWPARRLGTRQRHTGGKNAGAPVTKAAATAAAAQERPARHMARRAGRRKNLRTGKIRVRSFACPEGPCEPGPPKNASLFWLAQSFLLRIARSAEQKGAPPPFIPRSLLKKAGENFMLGGCVTAARKGLQSAALPRPRRPAPPLRTPCSRRVRIPWADGATAVPMAAEAAEAAGLPVPADPSGGPTA